MACLITRTEYYIVRGTWDASVSHISCSNHRQMSCAQKICKLLVNYLPNQWVKVYNDYSYPSVSESYQVTLMDTSQCHLPLNFVMILVFRVHYKGTILLFAYISQHQGQWGIEISLGTQALYFHQCLGTFLAWQYPIRRCCKEGVFCVHT